MLALIVFIISFIVLAILQFPILEILLFSIGIVLIFAVRVFWIFGILCVGLVISGFEIRAALIVSGIIAIGYWLGIILFTEHRSQTWMYSNEPWPRNIHMIEMNRVTYETYQDSALDMFFGRRKRKRRNLHEIDDEQQDDLQCYNKAIKEYENNPKTYTLDEVKDELEL